MDEQIQFLADDAPDGKRTRQHVIVDSQAWPFAFSEEGKAYARVNECSATSIVGLVEWIAATYPWPTKTDPVPGWRKRLVSLQSEKNPHVALKKYCDFLSQTEELRALIGESASQLDAHIQQQIDLARGK